MMLDTSEAKKQGLLGTDHWQSQWHPLSSHQQLMEDQKILQSLNWRPTAEACVTGEYARVTGRMWRLQHREKEIFWRIMSFQFNRVCVGYIQKVLFSVCSSVCVCVCVSSLGLSLWVSWSSCCNHSVLSTLHSKPDLARLFPFSSQPLAPSSPLSLSPTHLSTPPSSSALLVSSLLLTLLTLHTFGFHLLFLSSFPPFILPCLPPSLLQSPSS